MMRNMAIVSMQIDGGFLSEISSVSERGVRYPIVLSKVTVMRYTIIHSAYEFSGPS